MKKCPYCAEEIQDEAVKCKHCGSVLTESQMQATQEPSQPVETQQVKRKGGKFEAIGFLMIVAGIVGCMVGADSGGASLGIGLSVVGFIVFLAGRFV